MAENNNLVISAYGLSTTGKGQNLDNMYLNGRYINVPTETSSKIQKTETGAFQVYGVSDSEIGVGEDRSIGNETGNIVMEMLQYLKQTSQNSNRIEKEPIWNTLVEANRATKEIRAEQGVDMLGSSFAALFLHGNRGLAVHLGDSRIYVIRGGRTLQITDDHLESSDMFRLGILSQAQAEVHKASSRLTAYVGMDNIYDCRDEAFSKYFIFYPGDIFILCTDGVTDAILNDKMEKITRLLKDATPDQIAATLMDAAGEHSEDDRTLVVLRIEQVGNEVAARPVAQNIPQQSAFNDPQPMTPAVPTQYPLDGPVPPQAQAPVSSEPQTAPSAPQAQPMQPQTMPQTAQSMPMVSNEPVSFTSEPEPMQPMPRQAMPPMDEGEPSSNPLPAFLDKLLANPKQLAMAIGIAAGVLILLIVIIIAIAGAGKKKTTAENSSSVTVEAESSAPTTTKPSVDKGGSTNSDSESDSSTDVTPVYGSNDSSESSEEESSSSGVTTEQTYTVESGDTLYDIVDSFYDTGDLDYIEALAEYNNISVDDGLEVGQVLKIPTNETIEGMIN